MKSIPLQLIEAVAASNPIQSKYLAGCYEQLNDEEEIRFDAYLAFLFNRGLTLAYLTECYNTIVEDIKREQHFFMRHKRYRYASYAEVCNSVYLNDDYMERYMYGLAITSFLWPNHVAMNRFFAQNLPKNRRGNYLEVGPGHGLHFTAALNLCSFDAYHGVDISPKSVALTKDLVNGTALGQDKNCSVILCDFLTAEPPGKPYQALVMGEVIEHVERPNAFLKRAYDLTAPDAFIYLTTAINAPAIDHIYLLRNGEEFDELVKGASMRCEQRLLLPYVGKTVADCVEQALPMNIAAVLKKL